VPTCASTAARGYAPARGCTTSGTTEAGSTYAISIDVDISIDIDVAVDIDIYIMAAPSP
jgi:hypothetical protein